MTTIHHPDDATLMSYAAGSLGEALGAVVAAHLDRCGRCCHATRDLEQIGAALIEGIDGTVVTTRPTAARLAGGHGVRPASTNADSAIGTGDLPRPLARLLTDGLDAVPWRWLGPGVWHHRLALSPGVAGDLRLLKIAPGRRMPAHGHGGCELTLVLAGAYRDETGVFGRGDVQDVDPATEHRPVADPAAGCICLIASERPARFKGWMGRLMQPLTGM